MPTHNEERHSCYTPDQIFDLVTDVGSYPQFLPWCMAARVRERTDDYLLADVVIGYKIYREKFTSRAHFKRPYWIEVEYINGPLEHLTTRWEFEPADDGGTQIKLHIDFDFRSRMYRMVMEQFFHHIVKRMTEAFIKRANKLYGDAPDELPSPAKAD